MTFRELLLALDDLHDGATPETYPLIAGRAELLLWLESAVRRMIAAGGDADSLELILKLARAVCAGDGNRVVAVPRPSRRTADLA